MTTLGDRVRLVRHDEDGSLVHRVAWIDTRGRPGKRGDRARMVQMTCGAMTNTIQADTHVTTEPLSCVWCVAGTRRFP